MAVVLTERRFNGAIQLEFFTGAFASETMFSYYEEHDAFVLIALWPCPAQRLVRAVRGFLFIENKTHHAMAGTVWQC